MRQALGLVEITGLSPAMVAVDAMEKSAGVNIVQVEFNDLYGACVKITGPTAAVQTAMATAKNLIEKMHMQCVTDFIPNPEPAMAGVWNNPPEFSPLIEQDIVLIPKETPVSEQAPFAIGLIETQGLTAVIEAIDTACKAANVEVLGKEKLGGGYVTVIIKGDVAAVKAAIAAGQEKVNGLGKLIAAHVIARPSTAVLSLLPKS
ncbi:MAG TPA: BMC domain-containing protein [Tepidisphaeraceae bacterium]|nr:BMC domain-containing protein [Tepidisphaeraceae bacterium]